MIFRQKTGSSRSHVLIFYDLLVRPPSQIQHILKLLQKYPVFQTFRSFDYRLALQKISRRFCQTYLIIH